MSSKFQATLLKESGDTVPAEGGVMKFSLRQHFL